MLLGCNILVLWLATVDSALYQIVDVRAELDDVSACDQCVKKNFREASIFSLNKVKKSPSIYLHSAFDENEKIVYISYAFREANIQIAYITWINFLSG